MYVKDGDHPRHHKGSHNFRDSARKKAIYEIKVLTLIVNHKIGGSMATIFLECSLEEICSSVSSFVTV